MHSTIERQELHCHACQKYVQFDIDLSLNGNHILNCPNCDHEHCRVVRNGRITDIRWDSRNGPQHFISSASISYTQYSTFSVSSTTSVYCYVSWMNTVATS